MVIVFAGSASFSIEENMEYRVSLPFIYGLINSSLSRKNHWNRFFPKVTYFDFSFLLTFEKTCFHCLSFYRIQIISFLLLRFGLILERESDLSLSPSNPSLLVLHHPLDDLTRIVVHQKSGLPSIEWTSDRHKIIMTSKNPSICMTYDSELVSLLSNLTCPSTLLPRLIQQSFESDQNQCLNARMLPDLERNKMFIMHDARFIPCT